MSSEILAILSHAPHVFFALFARKLILSAELLAVVSTVGWRMDAHLGLPMWREPREGWRRASDVLAASSSIVVTLYVGFVRDFSELADASFTGYAWACLAAMACLAAVAAVWAGAQGRMRPSDIAGLIAVFGLALAGARGLDVSIAVLGPALQRLGQFFGVDARVATFHGLAFLSSLVVAAALSARIARWRAGSAFGSWDAWLVLSALALGQGFLAFRGVSALYILAAAGLVAWRLGWRMVIERTREGLSLRAFRTSSVQVGAGSEVVATSFVTPRP